MKTRPEKEIKNQLSQREIEVSDDSWEKLEQMLNAKSSDSKKAGNRNLRFEMIAAACGVLIAGLFLLKTNINPKPVEPEINKIIVNKSNTTKNEPINQVIQGEKTMAEKSTFVEKREKEKFTNIQTESAVRINRIERSSEKEQLAESISPEKVAEIIPEPEESKMITAIQTDSTQGSKKKVNYVDSEMLLYSVEHNQSVSSEKSASRLVIIDFNK